MDVETDLTWAVDDIHRRRLSMDLLVLPDRDDRHIALGRPGSPARVRGRVRASLALWPVPYRMLPVATPFGPTHVVESGSEDGEPIVLVHAASLSATQWYLQAAGLGSRPSPLRDRHHGGHRAVEPGTTDPHASRCGGLARGVLDGLELDDAIFIGSSFGGFQSVNLAVHQPDRVRALVLLAPAATIKPFKLLANLAIRTGSLLPLPATVRPVCAG